jgi:hypothetical protein
MADIQTTYYVTEEIIEQAPFRFFDFDRIQVAPQTPAKEVEFQSLSLAERHALLEKLIKRVKAL